MERQTIWMVGNGAGILTLEDTWVGALPLKRWPTFINIEAMPSLVAEFLDPNFNWLAEKLSTVFGKCLVDVILGLTRDNIGGQDKLIWAHSERTVMASSIIYILESPRSSLIRSNDNR
ncbi:hypothetical protein KSP39_PZI001068 [Platanthera zijinensis]|uniref:Uncharacterized protein n=1 Tax=Platanthera zijinensis TaxID=2320716 RepID=A0AAP0C613_9ASPA